MSAAPSALRAAAVAPTDGVLGDDTVRGVLAEGLEGHHRGESVLVLVPDHTRTAPLPLIVATLNDVLGEAAAVHVLVALGTHPPLDDRSLADLIGLDSIDPTDRHPGLTVGNHRWRDDGELVTVGVVTRDELAAIAGPLWHPSLGGDLPLRINRAVLEHDHVIIVGPTFPHEVVGFSGGAKYFFPGVSGPEMIDVSHWLGALSGVVETIGRVDTPTRRLIERAASLIPTPVTLVSMVVVGDARLAGLFVGDLGSAWSQAAALSAARHVRVLERPMGRVLSMAPPMYDELWTAAKAMYKLEPVLADDAELVIFAPHLSVVSRVHGEELARVGYHVLPYFLGQWDRFAGHSRAVLAHSSHVRGAGTYIDGVERPRVRVTLASRVPEGECRALGLGYVDPDSVDVAEWSDREHEGVLVVPRAGEILYRPAPL